MPSNVEDETGIFAEGEPGRVWVCNKLKNRFVKWFSAEPALGVKKYKIRISDLIERPRRGEVDF